jgi:hypothetical protein
VKPSGTGFPKPVALVSVGSTRYTRDLPGYSYPFNPFNPFSHPRLRTGKGEARGAIPWRFEGSTVGFKDWSKISVPQLGGIGFPPFQGCSNTLTMSGGTPWLCFARSTFPGTISWIPLVEWFLYGPRADSNQWIKYSMVALSGAQPRVHTEPGGTEFSNSVAPVSV